VLDMEASSPEERAKAYYRRGLANYAMNDLDSALSNYRDAETLNPKDMFIQSGIAKVNSRLKAHQEQQKKIYSKLFL
jgi:peptidyl-prolyl isomerase D